MSCDEAVAIDAKNRIDLPSGMRLSAEMLAETTGGNNELTAAVARIFTAPRENPEIAGAVHASSEKHSFGHLATSQNTAYADGFERACDLVYAARTYG